MTDRNEILVNFQALSNIEDLAICLDILEQKGWNLMAALNSVLPENNFTTHSTASVSHGPPLHARGGGEGATGNGSVPHHPQVVDLTREPLHPTPHTNQFSQPYSTRFHINTPIAGPGPSQTYPLSSPSSSSFFTSRGVGHPSASGLPPPYSVLSPPPPPPPAREDDDEDCVNILESTLSQSAPDPPITVSSSPSSSTYGDAYDHPNHTEEDDEEEEEEEEETMDDAGLDSLSFDPDYNVTDPAQRAMKEPLIPDSCHDATEAMQKFTTGFERRYGNMHPLFFIGSLKEAVQEATAGVGDHKPMLVYLHHDSSILSNVFCSQLLCSESVVSYLTNNFLSWAWDLTSPRHRKRLLDMIGDSFGALARARVNDIHSDNLPVILIVSKVQGSVDVRAIIHGETSLDGLMTQLITAVDEHNLQLEAERKEERERKARKMMIAEQNAAYQESLQADREKLKRKEQQRQQEEEEKQEREALRQSMASVVPDEPPSDTREKISTLRIRLPSGSTAQRRFLARNTLQDLLNYIGSMDYSIEEHKLLRSYPRTDLSGKQPDWSLEELGLCPQDTLFLEER